MQSSQNLRKRNRKRATSDLKCFISFISTDTPLQVVTYKLEKFSTKVALSQNAVHQPITIFIKFFKDKNRPTISAIGRFYAASILRAIVVGRGCMQCYSTRAENVNVKNIYDFVLKIRMTPFEHLNSCSSSESFQYSRDFEYQMNSNVSENRDFSEYSKSSTF